MDNIKCVLCGGSPDIELYNLKIGGFKTGIKVDICIGREIEDLLGLGVITLGCCCGHGEQMPNCLIDKSSIELCESLGYEVIKYSVDDNLYMINLDTNIQLELRKVLTGKVFRYLDNNVGEKIAMLNKQGIKISTIDKNKKHKNGYTLGIMRDNCQEININ